MSSDWDWSVQTQSTVIATVRAVAVYTNHSGDVVIRQEGTGYGDSPDDEIIVIPRSHAAALAKAIKAEAVKPFDPTE